MGFRDFQKFYNALLAKLVWHLLHQKNMLLFKVFSAKYFPTGSILKAPVHSKCSYAWRSILQAQDVINQGAIWRVGNGQLIDVWNHHWLPNPACSKIISLEFVIFSNRILGFGIQGVWRNASSHGKLRWWLGFPSMMIGIRIF